MTCELLLKVITDKTFEFIAQVHGQHGIAIMDYDDEEATEKFSFFQAPLPLPVVMQKTMGEAGLSNGYKVPLNLHKSLKHCRFLATGRTSHA